MWKLLCKLILSLISKISSSPTLALDVQAQIFLFFFKVSQNSFIFYFYFSQLFLLVG